jgi:hypothetical protein
MVDLVASRPYGDPRPRAMRELADRLGVLASCERPVARIRADPFGVRGEDAGAVVLAIERQAQEMNLGAAVLDVPLQPRQALRLGRTELPYREWRGSGGGVGRSWLTYWCLSGEPVRPKRLQPLPERRVSGRYRSSSRVIQYRGRRLCAATATITIESGSSTSLVAGSRSGKDLIAIDGGTFT